MKSPAASRYARSVVALACLLLSIDAHAQRLGTFNRITTPNGRQVLEIRQGLHPANPQLLFTAVITAGPTGGTTSVLLQQALVRDIFNQNAPAAGWTVVRSTSTAFSLGGGCGRNNLLDFPYINNNRPEILRITGTTQQVITLGIAGTDQYDSIDCRTQPNGRVLYMLTNRTRQRLELRREQGGLLQLVRDNFGVVATPFRGGARPSFNIFFRRLTNGAARADALPAELQGTPPGVEARGVVFAEQIHAEGLRGKVIVFVVVNDDDPVDVAECQVSQRTDPGAFNGVVESATTSTAVVGNLLGNNRIGVTRFAADSGGCTLQPTEDLGTAGPFSQYSFAGVVATEGHARPGLLFPHNTIVTPNQVITNDGVSQDVQPSPFPNPGGPRAGCAASSSEFETGGVYAGPGPSSVQLQQSFVKGNLSGIIMGTDMEDEVESVKVQCDPQPAEAGGL